MTKSFLKNMSNGVPILGQVTRKCKLVRLGEFKFKIILTQGLNRQIRRMCEYFDYKVKSLKRVRIMHIKLNDLQAGKWRNLNDDELNQLMKSLKK